MAIRLHRSNRTELLADALCEVLGDQLPEDPFVSYPIVVGSRGMERWLRHEIATRRGIASVLAFPFPRPAFTGAARWLLDGARELHARFWEPAPDDSADTTRWEPDALAFRLVELNRTHRGHAGFEAMSEYLGEEDSTAALAGAVSPRELLFARELAEVLDRLMRDRPDDARSWARDPESAEPRHRWLACLLRDLGAADDPASPLALDEQLLGARRGGPAPTGRSICVFGLSTMGPGDRRHLEAIARSMDVHLFVLAPTDHWFQHLRTRAEANQARRRVRDEAERRALEEELASDNPILTSLGAPSRDLQVWLEDVGYEDDQCPFSDAPVDPEQPRLLHRLQSWICAAQGPDEVPTAFVPDSSLTIHSTYGALRQVEVLRDELLAVFEADPRLEPRDVLVMTPDIETFAPLVAAVFARTGAAADATEKNARRKLPRIPVAIADLGLRRTNPVAEVLLKTLELAGERFTAGRLLDFLALEPVRRKWKLDDEAVADLRSMVIASGFRWGVDAADRGRVLQPELDQNTARFALERLALGVLMPDEDPLGVIVGPAGAPGPAVPMDVEGRERVDRVGRLGALLRAVAAHREAMQEPASLSDWKTRLVGALDELAGTSEKAGWLRAEVDGALEDLVRNGAVLSGLPVERAAVVRWLSGGFELAQRGDRVITGAVQVCAMEPMRSVPFRVIALLGMDDNAFPRGGRARTWDPMEKRRTGERDRREVDRHLLLEAILSAREHLLVFWSGFDVQQGKVQPAAVPVEELLENLEGLTRTPRSEWMREHPLQPWSPGSFEAPRASFDQSMAGAATTLLAIARGDVAPTRLGLAASGTEPLPPEALLPEVLEPATLANALCAPHKGLLRDRLRLSVEYQAPAVEDREPLELDTLNARSLRDRMLTELMAPQRTAPEAAQLVERLRDRLAGEGTLPLRAGGRKIFLEQSTLARRVQAHWTAIDGEAAGPLDLSVTLSSGRRLVGQVESTLARGGEPLVHERLLQWYTASSKPNDRLKLTAWVHLLAAVAAGHPVAGARLVGHSTNPTGKAAGGQFLSFSRGAGEALALLDDLEEVWRVSRERPLALFPQTSGAIAGVMRSFASDLTGPAARVKLEGEVANAWRGDKKRNRPGDADDPWIGTFFVDYDPVDHLDDPDRFGLIGLASRVWLPLVTALEDGKALAEMWLQREAQ